jgi:hypothetical protein
MQKALLHEHIIQAFSQTHAQGSMAVKVALCGNTVTLRGMSSAHFCALQYVMRILNQELVITEIGCEDEATSRLRARCKSISQQALRPEAWMWPH